LLTIFLKIFNIFFQTITKLETHIKSLEKLEYEMLQKVFNIFVDIPESVAVNIPGLRDPSSLTNLKKVQQKIKNKLKVAKEQLDCQRKVSKKVEMSLSTNDNVVVPDKKIKEVNRIPENILVNNHMLLYEKSCMIPTSSNENYINNLPNSQPFSNLNIEVSESNQMTDNFNYNDDGDNHNKLLNTNDVNDQTISSYNTNQNSNKKSAKIEFTKTDYDFSWELLAVGNFVIL